MFYFDTAIESDIRLQWSQLEAEGLHKSMIMGITTNPNALNKAYKHSGEHPHQVIEKLARLLKELRGDSDGILFVQWPASNTTTSLPDFCTRLLKLVKGNCRLGVKLPHYPEVRDYVKYQDLISKYKGQIIFNITGIADAFTASKWLGIPEGMPEKITWDTGSDGLVISLITGRMEEAGIDVKQHMVSLLQYNADESRVIAGSMRTLAQTVMAIEHGLTPTIGTTAFNNIFAEENGASRLVDAFFKGMDPSLVEPIDPPLISQTNIDLSRAFFEQMDAASKEIEPIYFN